MYLRSLLTAALAALLLVALAGCYGPAPGLDPSITFTVPDDTTLPNIPEGTLLVVTGDIGLADSGKNPVTSQSWRTEPANIGRFVVTGAGDAVNMVWQAPLVETPTDVTLRLDVRTLLGGEATASILVTVVPASEVPVYDFGDLLEAYPALEVPEHTAIPIAGSVRDGVTVLQYAWSTNPGSPNGGALNGAATSNPIWTTPALERDTEGVATPAYVVLTVEMLSDHGVKGTSAILLKVVPAS